MANNLIQIKRSLNTATPASLANGEFAYTANGDTLYIGSNGAVVPIGGKRIPGTLTANQALVANSTSGIDKVIVANAVISYLTANGSLGTSSQLLAANSTGGVYWMSAGSVGTNADAQYVWSNTHTFQNTITFSSTINGTANNALYLGSTIASDYQTTAGLSANVATLTANAAGYLNGKTEGNLNVNSASSATTANNSTYAFGKSENALNVNSALTANAASYLNGKLEANLNVNNSVTSNNASYVGSNTASDLRTYSETTASNAYTWATSNTLTRDGTYTGNNSFNGSTQVGDSTADILTINARVNTSIIPSANNTYDLGSSALRWKDLYLSGSTLQLGNTALSDTANGISTGNAYFTSNLKSVGNNIFGTTSSDTISMNGSVNTAILPSANVTYNLGTNSMRWNEVHASNLHATSLYIDGDASISGNLYVTGNVTTINVATLSVTDSLIQLASNNTSADLYDIGFFGNYQTGSAPHEHTGLFRDASDDGIYKLFFGLQTAPTTTIDTTDVTYARGMLDAYLRSGGLVSNATNVTITANGSLAVAITANTLSLTTALSGIYGGTGKLTVANNSILAGNSTNGYNEITFSTSPGYILQSNGTAIVYDTLDGGTF